MQHHDIQLLSSISFFHFFDSDMQDLDNHFLFWYLIFSYVIPGSTALHLAATSGHHLICGMLSEQPDIELLSLDSEGRRFLILFYNEKLFWFYFSHFCEPLDYFSRKRVCERSIIVEPSINVIPSDAFSLITFLIVICSSSGWIFLLVL